MNGDRAGYTRVSLWNKLYNNSIERKLYDDPATGKLAGAFLNQKNINSIEDWGCGHGGFANYIGDHQVYVGVDGSKSPFASKIADLEFYSSSVDAIHLRHVLEHNLNWEGILNNAIASFSKRMVVTIFTPFQDENRIINRYPNFLGTGVEMVDIGFLRESIVRKFSGLKWFSIENIKTETQYSVEHMFFLERDAFSPIRKFFHSKV